MLSVPSAFTETTGKAHWHALLRARAIENGAFVIAPAQGGTHANGRHTYGHSLIVSPWGEVLAEAGTEPGVIVADIDPALCATRGRAFPIYARPAVRSAMTYKSVSQSARFRRRVSDLRINTFDPIFMSDTA